MTYRRKNARAVNVEALTNHDIICQNINFGYSGDPRQEVFQNFQLSIPLMHQGWLRGANGVGKTTLLRLLAGLEEPEAGTLCWPPHLASAAVVFLSHLGVLPDLAILRKRAQEPMLPEVRELWQVLGVKTFWDREGLSAGQRQRIGIAWVFASSASVIILDEPFAFIAEPARAPILQAMLACASAQGQYFLVASNDPFPQAFTTQFHRIDLDVMGIKA